MKLSALKRDVSAAENGVWVTEAYGDIDLLIASTDNKKYKEMLQKLMKPYTKNKAYEHMSDQKFENDIDNKCLAKYILLGWRNLQDDEGNEIPYSEETAYNFLCDPENIEFRKIVVDLAREGEVFRKEVRDEIATKS